MTLVDQFESFAADFEAAVNDDDWTRLGKYFTNDATYSNVGDPDSECEGRDAILAYFKLDVTNTDRRFDSRTLAGLAAPVADSERLSRRWRSTYTLDGAPDLVLEGESRYLFKGDLIKALEVELTEESMQTLDRWMRQNGDKLQARGPACSQ